MLPSQASFPRPRIIQEHAPSKTGHGEWVHFFRLERAARIYDGADEVHKSAAARGILKRYREAAEADG